MSLFRGGPARGPLLPRESFWKSQKLDGRSQAVAKKLRAMKVDLSFEASQITDIIAFISDFSGVSVKNQATKNELEFTFKVRDQPLDKALDLLLLPNGWDVKMEDGVLVVFDQED